ncbi:MAG: hypothetical protein LBR60_05115 [Fibrobacter sp.]|jgi:hypothetical protein|nr:hypothetical protein [Fibrobacter sp.]
MATENEPQTAISQIVFNNLKEMLKAKNAAHESIFKLHWKKMWPFNLLWPQVDYLRIIRLMQEIEKNTVSQKAFIRKNISAAGEKEIDFLKAVPAYLDSLADSCRKLAVVAQFKQDKLEKKQDRSVFKFNQILKDYEKSQTDLVNRGALLQLSWIDITQ